MTFALPLRNPPVRVQTEHQCWSAAYESWSTACSRLIRGARGVSEADIEAMLARFPNSLDANGSATRAGVGLLASQGDLHYQAISGSNLTASILQDQLSQFGYIYLVFWAHGRAGPFSHAVVISNATDSHMRVMDPVGGRGLQTKPIAYYANAIVMLLGTHKLAHRS
jgi:hypothetical protein